MIGFYNHYLSYVFNLIKISEYFNSLLTKFTVFYRGLAPMCLYEGGSHPPWDWLSLTVQVVHLERNIQLLWDFGALCSLPSDSVFSNHYWNYSTNSFAYGMASPISSVSIYSFFSNMSKVVLIIPYPLLYEELSSILPVVYISWHPHS